ncbi:putative wall-associated receptor kinase-like 11 [Cryptomeria japonica]|uniref:putative wall-associated receptor kinase-like 11 n=1 Tax=Cryptomeria japonica TaxID=3369 RepID=UPI0027DA04F2|nr:putative wall-associated receptor kinase-like 11 [Cryptomeria japonica]
MCVEANDGGICHNFVGSYNCSCRKGYKGDGYRNGSRCVSKNSNYLKLAITGSVSSFVGVSIVACGLFWWLSMRRLKHAREKNFRQNGGILFQERIASMGGKESFRMFSERELEIASNKFSTELGKGGFATVYKGVLVDGMHVAIKKPKSISNEFINEIIILSHISHRNVVKMLGCFMESQFPLLVYEFVPNGTVFEHLHSTDKQLTWEQRRQIAIETAEAIAYVHLQASQPIFHRDIKSSNILLDNTFTPKVADFGVSRLRPSDENHLSTVLPSGTPGYVDPEFVRSNQFTDKSDVFSFGVILVELLTGLMPLLSVGESTCALYDHFLSAINDNRLNEILDPKVVKEEIQGQMENMARLTKACLQMKAKARPSMREVVDELVWIRAATKQPELYRDVSLVENRGDPKQTRLNYHALLNTTDSTPEDYYQSSPSVTAIS